MEAMFPFVELSPNSTGVYSKVLRFGLTVLAGDRRFSHTMFLGDSLELYEALFSVNRLTKSISSVTRFFKAVIISPRRLSSPAIGRNGCDISRSAF